MKHHPRGIQAGADSSLNFPSMVGEKTLSAYACDLTRRHAIC